MVTGSWLNNDGLLLQYGTQKAIPEAGGDYLAYGSTRMIEVSIDLTSLTTSPQVQSLTSFFPAGNGIFVEKVEVVTDIVAATGTSFSCGLGYFSGSTYGNITTNVPNQLGGSPAATAYTGSYPGVTAISNTAFVNAMTAATYMAAAGDTVTLWANTAIPVGAASFAGGYLGTTSGSLTHPNYITALSAGSTFTTGVVRVRIFYRGYGTIQN